MLPHREIDLTLRNKGTFPFRNQNHSGKGKSPYLILVFLYNSDQISIGRETLNFLEF